MIPVILLSMVKPKYSICMVTKNCENTIQQALLNILNQVDNDYEVIVVDESTDKTPEILMKLQTVFPILKVVSPKELGVSSRISIGEARNISVREASGEYCILHIDGDDLWEPLVPSFIEVFKYLESKVGESIFLAGRQINVGNRKLLTEFGPYRNLLTGEDRDLLLRLASANKLYFLNHRIFFTRLKLSRRVQLSKALKRTWIYLVDDFRAGNSMYHNIRYIASRNEDLTIINRMFRLFAMPFAYIYSKTLEKLDNQDVTISPSEWKLYKEEHTFDINSLLETLPEDHDLRLDFLNLK